MCMTPPGDLPLRCRVVSQTPIYDQLRGERIDVDVLAIGGANPQRIGHTGRHRLHPQPAECRSGVRPALGLGRS